jgi:hypothetical protein
MRNVIFGTDMTHSIAPEIRAPLYLVIRNSIVTDLWDQKESVRIDETRKL